MIGIYDSGIGGLAVLENLQKIQPNFSFLYLADQELFPIGQKSIEQVIQRLLTVFSYFQSKGCNQVLLACNTVSTVYSANIDVFKAHLSNLEIYPISLPTVDLLVSNYKHLHDKNGLLIATTTTIDSRYYQTNLSNFTKLKYTYLRTLAWAIEEQNYEEIRSSLLQNSQISWETLDYLILGCTHYTWIKPIFNFLNPNMLVIDPVTETIGTLSQKLNLPSQKRPQKLYLSTGKKIKLSDKAYKFKKVKIKQQKIA